MKRILFTILFSFICIIGNAQNEYSYMSCDLDLFEIKSEMADLNQDIGIRTNSVLHNVYNGIYNNELYDAYVGTYDSFCNVFESKKEFYNVIKEKIILIIPKSNFSDSQINVINAHFSVIDKSINSIEQSLKLYKLTIQLYKEK